MSDPQHFERPQPGWQMIEPGVYLDTEESLHIFEGEFLEAHGYVDTPANREMLRLVLPDVIAERYGVKIPAWYTTDDKEPERIS